jgi:purine-binding chemotaxis protein CheW
MHLPDSTLTDPPAAPVAALEPVPANPPSQYLTFMLTGAPFAIGILAIKEIIEFARLTTVPMMPRAIRGVINVRGAIVPVIDLAACFGQAALAAGRRSCVVIVEIAAEEGSQDVGVLVDAVSEVLDIPSQQIEPAPAFGAAARAEFIAGMAKVDAGFITVLNVAAIVATTADRPQGAPPIAPH